MSNWFLINNFNQSRASILFHPTQRRRLCAKMRISTASCSMSWSYIILHQSSEETQMLHSYNQQTDPDWGEWESVWWTCLKSCLKAFLFPFFTTFSHWIFLLLLFLTFSSNLKQLIQFTPNQFNHQPQNDLLCYLLCHFINIWM